MTCVPRAGMLFGVHCSASDARATELAAATEAQDVREAALQQREEAVEAAAADVETREEELGQQKTDMAAQEVGCAAAVFVFWAGLSHRRCA